MTTNNHQFLILYDYGQGGVWGIVTAESKNDVVNKMPYVKVKEQGPPWRNAAIVAQIPEKFRFSIDDVPVVWR